MITIITTVPVHLVFRTYLLQSKILCFPTILHHKIQENKSYGSAHSLCEVWCGLHLNLWTPWQSQCSPLTASDGTTGMLFGPRTFQVTLFIYNFLVRVGRNVSIKSRGLLICKGGCMLLTSALRKGPPLLNFIGYVDLA